MINAAKVQLAFGAGLLAWRKQRGYTQLALAERSGLHRTFIADVERGVRNPSLQSMAKIAEGLEISIPDLFQPPPANR